MSAQPDLFSATEAASVPATVNFYESAARAKRGFGSEWEAGSWESMGDGVYKLRGGVTSIGKNGRRRWPAKLDTVFVTEQDVEAACAKYETETGRCRVCYGTGRAFSGWHHIEGVRTKPCSRCNETGKPS